MFSFSGLSGGAIAGIVLACLAVIVIVLILVVARTQGKLCFGGERYSSRNRRQEHRREEVMGGGVRGDVETSKPAAEPGDEERNP